MLLDANQSCLLLVDMQERLLPVIHEHQRVAISCGWLVGVADLLGVPVLCSEQYPRGLGRTVEGLRLLLPDDVYMEKVHFSCAEAPACIERIEGLGRRQVVIGGVEAHVCVLQTAIGLRGRGHEVFVVAEAVSSRDPRSVELAFDRLRQEGVRVVSGEMVAFEWAQRAGTDEFRKLSKEFLK